MRVLTAALVATTVAVAGCGSDMHGVSQGDVQAYAALSQQIGTSAAAYGTAASATIDASSCLSTHTSYDGQVHPMVDRMRSMSGAMDQQMGMMGGGGGMMDPGTATTTVACHRNSDGTFTLGP